MPEITHIPIEKFQSMVGYESPPSDWFLVDQSKIDQFADLTTDDQFIHVDPVAAAKTPFGGTVAHGFYTLSLIVLGQHKEMLAPEGTVMAVNYGMNKLRFMSPVRSGKRIRVNSKMLDFTEKSPNQYMLTSSVSVEIENEPKPALVCETLTLFHVEK